MPSDRQRDHVDAMKEWRRQQDEMGGWSVSERAGWRASKRVDGVLHTTVRELTPEKRDALTVPAGSFDHYRQDPSDPATLDTEALMVRVAEGRVLPRDASAIVARKMAVARDIGREAFYVLLSVYTVIGALSPRCSWAIRFFLVGVVCFSVLQVYQIRRSQRSLEE